MTTIRSVWRASRFVNEQSILLPETFEFLQSLVNAVNGLEDGAGFRQFGFGGVTFTVGTGSPNTVVLGSPPDLYLNLSGGAGTTFYVKESGTATNTGWVGK